MCVVLCEDDLLCFIEVRATCHKGRTGREAGGWGGEGRGSIVASVANRRVCRAENAFWCPVRTYLLGGGGLITRLTTREQTEGSGGTNEGWGRAEPRCVWMLTASACGKNAHALQRVSSVYRTMAEGGGGGGGGTLQIRVEEGRGVCVTLNIGWRRENHCYEGGRGGGGGGGGVVVR